jgi:hypothetical protein
MKIKIIKDINIAVDCRTNLSFKKDKIVDMDDKKLINRLIELEAAEEVKSESKSFKAELENKAVLKVEEDKVIEVKEVKKTTKKKGKK